jgi:urease accessory protein
MGTAMTTTTNLVRLLQLASPTLPVGAYSYSQGLEAAIEAGIVKDAESAGRWIKDVLDFSVASMEAPVLFRLLTEEAETENLNTLFLASRETAELRAETVQMGYSLCRLLGELGIKDLPQGETAFPTAFAFAAREWGIEPREALVGYLWSWLENQVMAAIKGIPLGQTDGQKILLSIANTLPSLAEQAMELKNPANFAPGLAMLSSRHETQYSRIFRS